MAEHLELVGALSDISLVAGRLRGIVEGFEISESWDMAKIDKHMLADARRLERARDTIGKVILGSDGDG